MREYQGPSDLMAVFTRPSIRSELTVADFHFVGEDVQVLASLLRNAVAARASGVNVLLYGPPGTGKTELARVAAQAAGLELYEVEYADRDGNSLSGRDRYRSLQISQVVPEGQPRGRAAVRQDGRRVPADLHRRRAVDGPARHRRRPSQRQRQR